MVSSGSDVNRTPVVGLTTYLERAKQGVWDVRASFLPQQYFDAVTASGPRRCFCPRSPGRSRPPMLCSTASTDSS